MFKQIAALTFLMFLQPAFATANEACTKFVPCGTYEGTGNWFDVDGKQETPDDFNEKIVFQPVGKMGVRTQVYIYRGTEPKLWREFILRFDASGAFRIPVGKNKTAVTGICQNKVCTISFHPVAVNRSGQSYVNSYVNIIRFENDKLTRHNMVMNESDFATTKFQRSRLVKK